MQNWLGGVFFGIAFASVGCGPHAGATMGKGGNGGSGGGGGGLSASLRAAAGGKPVMLVGSATGVEARTPDGTWSKPIVSGAAMAASYDPDRDLLWWWASGDTLSVIDLRGDGTPVPIATGVVKADTFEVVTPDGKTHDATALDTSARGTWYVTIDVAQGTVTGAALDDADPDDTDTSTIPPAPTLVGGAWLAAQAQRPLRGVTHATWDDGSELCDDCDKATDFGKPALKQRLAFQLVTCYDDEGMCEGVCAIFAPGQTMDQATPVDCDLQFDASESQWIGGGKLCDASGCKDAGASEQVLGWLDPGRIIDDPMYPAPNPDDTGSGDEPADGDGADPGDVPPDSGGGGS